MEQVVNELMLKLRKQRFVDAFLNEDTDRYIHIVPTNEWIRIHCDNTGFCSAIFADEATISESHQSAAYRVIEDSFKSAMNEDFDCLYRYVETDDDYIKFVTEKLVIKMVHGELEYYVGTLCVVRFNPKENTFTCDLKHNYDDFFDYVSRQEIDFFEKRFGHEMVNQSTTQLFYETMSSLKGQEQFLIKVGFINLVEKMKEQFVNRTYGTCYLYDILLKFLTVVSTQPNGTSEERKAAAKLAKSLIFPDDVLSFADFVRPKLSR